MKIRKVTAADLKLGMLIPWNVYGENGVLLVRKGHMITSANQIAYLIERGSFEDHDGDQESHQPPSALRKLNAAYVELPILLQAVAQRAAPPGLRRKLEDIAAMIGVSRQTLNKALKAMEREGVIALDYARIRVVDAEGLRRLGKG